jgi:heme-degrading monooxygenase HmoA
LAIVNTIFVRRRAFVAFIQEFARRTFVIAKMRGYQNISLFTFTANISIFRRENKAVIHI